MKDVRQKPEQSPGRITLKGDNECWHNEDLVFATIDLSDVVVIGEQTNSNGPWFVPYDLYSQCRRNCLTGNQHYLSVFFNVSISFFNRSFSA